ncbi:chemotaxis protein CheC [Frigoriglobus tundricola]|uniref:Chemotaxis protein CheC--inhibitor of MCP methylation n=1 Tax=Frigoriglobus tundricola TaxID=2774151 RepID=A0A6M5YXR6_9BACT|nr:chemotaxis protein CheC [Frigoriglobus tundricola]QJW98186.1 Chemotaxis protein CheC -- inhibitor of MCP methylation [Frigoriglobus tundricola]
MILSEEQKDSVTELVNIAFSRTAAALSELTGNRVDLAVPDVSAYPIAELLPALGRFVRGEVATVHQIFGGPVSGDAFLLLDIAGAARLVDLLSDAGAPTTHMGASAREVLAEVGNILLNACLGVFGDLLQVRFTFTVPRLHLDSLGSMLGSLEIGGDEIRHALLIGARFHVRGSEVTGCMVMVLGVTSLDRFVEAIENWAERATQS